MVEKIIVNPEKVRGLGDIVSPKTANDFELYNSEISVEEDTVYGSTMNVFLLEPQKIQTSITESSLDTDFALDWSVILKDENNTSLVGKTVKFYLDNVLKATKTTTNMGTNWYDYSVMGTHTIKAVFEGDGDYKPSQLEKTVTIGF